MVLDEGIENACLEENIKNKIKRSHLKGVKPGKVGRNRGTSLGYEANIVATIALIF